MLYRSNENVISLITCWGYYYPDCNYTYLLNTLLCVVFILLPIVIYLMKNVSPITISRDLCNGFTFHMVCYLKVGLKFKYLIIS